jgi:hypothetical protein
MIAIRPGRREAAGASSAALNKKLLARANQNMHISRVYRLAPFFELLSVG